MNTIWKGTDADQLGVFISYLDADLARNTAPITVSGPLDGEFSINLCHKWKCLEETLIVQKAQAAI